MLTQLRARAEQGFLRPGSATVVTCCILLCWQALCVEGSNPSADLKSRHSSVGRATDKLQVRILLPTRECRDSSMVEHYTRM